MTKSIGHRATVLLIVSLALVLRVYIGITRSYEVHPDEVCDYLDRGFRLVYGYGCDPWTYTYGMRSYVFPGIIAGIIWLFSGPTNSPDVYIGAITVFMSLLSLSIVVCALEWGRRTGGWRGAIIAGFMAATWFELIYYGPHTLSEVMATNFLVVAVCLYRDDSAAAPTHGRALWIGLCLGLTVAFRLQLVPAAGVVVLWIGWRHGWRVMLRIAAAAAVPVFATGMLDWVTYKYPFQSYFMYFYATLMSSISSFYPTYPFYYYINVENHYLVGLFPAFVLAALYGGRRQPLLLLVVAAIFVSHSAIGLKLPRYIYPTIPFALVLAAQTVTEMLDRLARNLPPRRQAAALATLLLAFGTTSWSLAREGPFSANWLRSSGAIAASRVIAAKPDVCGIGGYKTGTTMYTGFVRWHHNVPVILISRPERFEQDAVSFNVLMTPDDVVPPGNLFTRVQCWPNGYTEASYNHRTPDLCLWFRPGGCQAGAIADPDPDRPPGW
jgi:hypothetical protein